MVAVAGNELARLRSDLEAWMTETAEVMRPERVSDGKGGYTNTMTSIWNGTVRRNPVTETARSVSEINIGDLATALSYWRFAFPAGTDVQPEDRIIVSGRTYEVAGPALDKTTELARYVITVEKV